MIATEEKPVQILELFGGIGSPRCALRNPDQWATPDDFFKELDQEFHFNLDPCADEQNHKCEKYFTKEDNGLSKDWGGVSRVLQSSVW